MSYQWNIPGLSPTDRALGVYAFPVFRVEYQWSFPTAPVEYNIHFIYLWYRPALMQTEAAYTRSSRVSRGVSALPTGRAVLPSCGICGVSYAPDDCRRRGSAVGGWPDINPHSVPGGKGGGVVLHAPIIPYKRSMLQMADTICCGLFFICPDFQRFPILFRVFPRVSPQSAPWADVSPPAVAADLPAVDALELLPAF